MPVIYYVDPAILKDKDARDLNEITLSYTFFREKSAVDSERTEG
jgi:cytochrome c oxidase assembly protein subunit 11